MNENMEVNVPMEQQQEAPMTMDAPQDGAVPLSSFFEEASSAADNQPEGGNTEQPQETGNEVPTEQTADYSIRTQENKALRGRYQEDVRRGIEEGMAKERTALMESMKAEFQKQFQEMMAPLREAQVEQEAQKLIASKKIADPELAKEFARMRLGINAQPQQGKPAEPERPRDAQGRFTAPQQQQNQPSADMQARAQMLGTQAEQIRRDYGLDMISALRTDPVIQDKVGSGAWDFRDAALYLSRKTDNGGARQPVAVRSPNNTRVTSRFSEMSDEEFARFEASIASGKKYDIRR